MCYICSCFTDILDIIQRILTFICCCWLCVAISCGFMVAIVAGCAFGYNYMLAEFLTLSRPDSKTDYGLRKNEANVIVLRKAGAVRDIYKNFVDPPNSQETYQYSVKQDVYTHTEDSNEMSSEKSSTQQMQTKLRGKYFPFLEITRTTIRNIPLSTRKVQPIDETFMSYDDTTQMEENDNLPGLMSFLGKDYWRKESLPSDVRSDDIIESFRNVLDIKGLE